MGKATGGQMGTMEMILATAYNGVIYAAFSGQPLTIIGSTLRNKNEKQKSLLFQEACKNLLPHIFEGTIRPLISKIKDQMTGSQRRWWFKCKQAKITTIHVLP